MEMENDGLVDSTRDESRLLIDENDDLYSDEIITCLLSFLHRHSQGAKKWENLVKIWKTLGKKVWEIEKWEIRYFYI